MDVTSSLLPPCAALIAQHFQIPTEELGENHSSEKALEDTLAAIIRRLLDHDMARLMNIFYKIDLDEDVLKRVVATEHTENISETLAKEVIKRELQKVKTRIKYRDS